MNPGPKDETAGSSSLGIITNISHLTDSDDQRMGNDPFSVEPSLEDNLFRTISNQDIDSSTSKPTSPLVKHSTPNTSGAAEDVILGDTLNLKITKDDDPSFEIFQDEPSYTVHAPKLRRRMTLQELREKEDRGEFMGMEPLRELKSQEEAEERAQRRYGSSRPKPIVEPSDKTFVVRKVNADENKASQSPSTAKPGSNNTSQSNRGSKAGKLKPPKVYLAFVYVGTNGVKRVAYNSNLPNPDISSLGLDTMDMDTFGTFKNFPKPRNRIMSKGKRSCSFCHGEILRNSNQVSGSNHAKCELEAIISSMDKGPSNKKVKLSDD